jgi:hypothetical protein
MASGDVREMFAALTEQWDSLTPYALTAEAGGLSDVDRGGLEALGYEVTAGAEAGLLEMVRGHVARTRAKAE